MILHTDISNLINKISRYCKPDKQHQQILQTTSVDIANNISRYCKQHKLILQTTSADIAKAVPNVASWALTLSDVSILAAVKLSIPIAPLVTVTISYDTLNVTF